MLLNPFSYHHPKNLDEAIALLVSLPDAKILAGGTFLMNTLKLLKKRGLKTPSHIISLKKIKKLNGIRIDSHSVTINSMTTMGEIMASQELEKSLPIIVRVAENIATTQIRNMATIGGNIASRYTWTEFNNCLLALEAKLQFILPNKKIATIPMDEFLSKNAKVGGILTSITIDLKRNTLATYQRLPKSSDVDVPLFTVCLKAEIDNRSLKDVRAVVYKGVSFPKREKRIEQALEGLTLGSTAQKELDHHRWQIEDGHLSEDKKMILAAMIKEAVLDLLAKAK